MSFDLYLLPARVVAVDANLARDYIERENARFSEIPNARDPECERRKRELADLLLRLKPTFREFNVDFQTIADWEKVSVDEARRKYRYIEVDGSSEPAEAQFVFHDNYVVIHWYSGTPFEEMDAILYSLSLAGDFVVFDPQSDEVYDLREERLFDAGP
jgi:hypothetical protein